MGDVPRRTTFRPVSSISNAPILHDSFFIFVFFPEIAKLASILCADREMKQVCHCETFVSRRSLFSRALFVYQRKCVTEFSESASEVGSESM